MPFSIRYAYDETSGGATIGQAVADAYRRAFLRDEVALITDGSIHHACGTGCLAEIIDSLPREDRTTLALATGDTARRSGQYAGEVPYVFVGADDANVTCDNCHAQIGDHFGDCLICNRELIIHEDGSDNGFYFLTTHFANNDRFGGVCDDCVPAWRLNCTNADGSHAGWNLDGDETASMVEHFGEHWAERIETAFMVDALHTPRTMRGDGATWAALILTDADLWAIIHDAKQTATNHARGVRRIVGIDWTQYDAPIPVGWFGPYDSRGAILRTLGVVSTELADLAELLDREETAQRHAANAAGPTIL